MEPRVLVVTNLWPTVDDPTFGVFVHEQVEAVRALGARIDVVFVDGRTNRRRYASAIGRVRRQLAGADGRYDVVHAHYVLAGLVAWLARWPRRRPPLVVTHHGIEVFEGWQAPLARWISARAEKTLVISPAMARHLGLGAEAVVPCGVDLTVFRPGSQTAARAELGLPSDRPLIAWVGVDRPEKQLALARAAIDALRSTRPTAELLVVAGLPHRAVAGYLQASDVLLVTSTREGGPLVVKEALACDRPVVSTDVGDVRALIAGLPGCAVVDDTPEDLAAAIDRALTHGPVVAGRAAVEPYRAETIARRVLDVYRMLGAERS